VKAARAALVLAVACVAGACSSKDSGQTGPTCLARGPASDAAVTDAAAPAMDGAADAGAPFLVTSSPGAYWSLDGQVTEAAAGAADVTVVDGCAAQTWEGFGGAFNEIGWNVLSMLPPADRDHALQLLYGDDGARFAFGRIPIGASDYAMDRYTDDEVPAGETDPTLASFSIERDKAKLIPFIKAAQAVRPNIRLWATPWTAPTWMKQGPFAGSMTTPFDGGSIKTDAQTMTALAQYFVSFVRAYAQEGITVEAIGAQNEPNYTGTYPTCGWSPGPYATFIGQYLAPAVAASGLPTKIILGTLNGGGSDPQIVTSVMNDPAARAAVSVLGFQWGMQSHIGEAKKYGLPIWQTEHRCGNYPWMKPFNMAMAPNDQAYAVESWGLIRDWIRAGVTAYSAWNMVLDTVGVGIDSTRVWPQDALLTVDTTAKTLIVTPAYYVFRHVSQFVTPGAKVVATRGGDALAFNNPDGSWVAVLYNSGAAKMTTVAIAGRKLQFAMPASGWATVVAR